MQAYRKVEQMAMADGRHFLSKRIIKEDRNVDGSFYTILEGISRE